MTRCAFILKRWNYKPADAIEVFQKADNIMDSTLRLTYVDLTSISNGDYTIDGHIPRFAATKLFFENDCKTDKKFLKQLKKVKKASINWFWK